MTSQGDYYATLRRTKLAVKFSSRCIAREASGWDSKLYRQATLVNSHFCEGPCGWSWDPMRSYVLFVRMSMTQKLDVLTA